MEDAPTKPSKVSRRCTIYVGGNPWEITNIHTTMIGGMEYIIFTEPNGKVCENFRNRPAFGDDQEGAELAIACSIGGITRATWEGLNEDKRESIRETFRKRLAIAGGENIGIFYG